MISPSSFFSRRIRNHDWFLFITLTLSVLLKGLIIAYQATLRQSLSTGFRLSFIERIIFGIGDLLIDPVLLFAVTYIVAIRYPIDLKRSRSLIAVAGACALGYSFGLGLGIQVWKVPEIWLIGDGIFPVRNSLTLFTLRQDHTEILIVVISWIHALLPIIRASITAFAAIGLASLYGSVSDPTSSSHR